MANRGPPAKGVALRSEIDGERWSGLAREALRQRGRRSGGARRAVVELLARRECCLSAEEIYAALRKEGETTGIASIYRALELLRERGLVQRIDLGSGPARYEAAVPGGDHHHHALCERCGQITPFEDPALERALERLDGRLGLRMSGHDVLIRGACTRCSS